jgi:lipoate-protein ligase A
MDLLDLTLPTPAENLALDEALLDEAEGAAAGREVLRLWEAAAPLVVLGRNSLLADEVDAEACRRRGIGIFRRASGGAAILAGPGCLMYALVLSYELRPKLRMLDEAHRFVLNTIARALAPVCGDARPAGTSDLVFGPTNLKFSGNSMRCRRRSFLYHGTLLYDFPLALVSECLKLPPRQPAYRENRPHESFLANLPVSAAELRRILVDAWQAEPTNRPWPRARLRELVARGYRPIA